ncbi:hypothetical protein ACVIHI_001503 [Bradyrhizobium sp. USDA 4524]|nr:hypothetical protein [Bradyrhizobium sp. USDA 4538]MCP1906140.1 hypothetical protein [Bradyrhizobium sp. USDA 4537]MCP1988206.1 hypothetical protein [Bradyrhizobium sp. USDA 4539]
MGYMASLTGSEPVSFPGRFDLKHRDDRGP